MIEPTELRLDEDYELYYINWCRTVLNAFVPFLLLAFLNGRIIYQLKVSTNLSATRVSSGTYSIPRLYFQSVCKQRTKLQTTLLVLCYIR